MTGDGGAAARAAAALCRRFGLGARGTAGTQGENRPEALKKRGAGRVTRSASKRGWQLAGSRPLSEGGRKNGETVNEHR